MSCQLKPREGDGSAAARGKLTEGYVEDEEGVGVANWRRAGSPEARHLAGDAAAAPRRGRGAAGGWRWDEMGKRGKEDDDRQVEDGKARKGRRRGSATKVPILLGHARGGLERASGPLA